MFSIYISIPNYRWEKYVPCKVMEECKVEKAGLLRIETRTAVLFNNLSEFKS
jgi:hypothetical protein